MNESRPWRVEPKIATCRDEVIAYAQSRYSVAPTNSILNEAMARRRQRLGLVGLPCHIHGFRKIQAMGRPKPIGNAVKFTIGLFCGVGANYRGTEHRIEELCGVPLEQVTKVEYRGGEYPGSFRVTTKAGKVITRPYSSGMVTAVSFYRDRCLMCYDYTSELADLAVGDYYHPDMKQGVKGWSVIIVRSDVGMKLVEEAQAANYLHAEPVAVSYLLGAGWELKRHGAVYRLLERQRHNWPTPNYHVPLDYPHPMYRVVDSSPPYAKTSGKSE